MQLLHCSIHPIYPNIPLYWAPAGAPEIRRKKTKESVLYVTVFSTQIFEDLKIFARKNMVHDFERFLYKGGSKKNSHSKSAFLDSHFGDEKSYHENRETGKCQLQLKVSQF